MLDEVEPSLSIKIQEIIMTGSRDVGKSLQKCSKNVFPNFDPRDFVKNWSILLLYPCGALTPYKKLEKLMRILQDI